MVGPISATISAIYIVHIYMENGKVVDYKNIFFFWFDSRKEPEICSDHQLIIYIHTYIYIYIYTHIYPYILIYS